MGLASHLIVLVCAQIGCMVPQTIDPLDPPGDVHPAPHFVQQSIPDYLLAPPVITLIRQGSSDASRVPPCHCQIEFRGLQVEEDDPTVSLNVRWFIDYDPSVPSSVRIWSTETLRGNFNDATALLRQLSSFAFDADQVGIASSGIHVVDVVVGETTGFDEGATARPNRTMLPGFTSAEMRFTINVHFEPDQTRAACPSAPPSLRVCQ